MLDRVIGRAGNPVEARAYTDRDVTFGDSDVLLQGEFETARITFAADRPARLRRATALLTSGNGEPPVMIRWQTQNREKTVTLATVLSRGSGKVALDVESDDERLVVTATGDGWTREIAVSPRLEPLDNNR